MTEPVSKRMTNLRDSAARGIYLKHRAGQISEARARELADAALAALGLDDLNAFAFRVWKDLPSEYDRADVENAIKAALSTEGEG